MSDVTLSSAVRGSLLSLQSTTDLIDRTNSRLSSGLRVASPIDDPVAFFSAKTLNDRAFDFSERKDGIDQGVSTVTAALDGVESIDSLVRQLKGIANSLKSATGSQFTDLVTQFNDIRGQIGDLAGDAEYQGVNLVDGTSQTLTVNFANNTSSILTINSTNLRESGLGIDAAEFRTDTKLSFSATTGTGITVVESAAGAVTSFSGAGGTFNVTFNGTGERVFTTTGGNSLTLSFGTATFTIRAATSGDVTITKGAVITLQVVSTFQASDYGSGSATGVSVNLDNTSLLAVYGGTQTLLITGAAASNAISLTDASGAFQGELDFVGEGLPDDLDTIITGLDTALTTLRSESQKLGSNVALLQTRLDFTEAYINTLEEGAGKLTLADLNGEGANLLALQTRQQLGISALAFAGQSEQGILALFN
ncbi:MAG: flagellin [Rhodospirillales bacterium]